MTAQDERPAAPAAELNWSAKLRQPFPPALISYKPVISCAQCRSAPSKVCANHTKQRCGKCHQTITTGHLHLDYVGHADVTDRLLDVDPEWNWEPAYRDVDKDMLNAAILTGQAEIVNAVIANSPPLIDAYGGMWIKLSIHDGEGGVIERLGYGDAEGKAGANAVKERIGDALRNAAMRGGAALALWSKSDRAELEADRGDPAKRTPRPKPADDKPADAKPDPLQEQADKLAKLCRQIVVEGSGEDALREVVYNIAQRQRILRREVLSPFTSDQRSLSEVITQTRQRIKDRDADAADEAAHAERGPEPEQ